MNKVKPFFQVEIDASEKNAYINKIRNKKKFFCHEPKANLGKAIKLQVNTISLWMRGWLVSPRLDRVLIQCIINYLQTVAADTFFHHLSIKKDFMITFNKVCSKSAATYRF